MMRRRQIFTDPTEKQNINPWKMKLLSCLTLGVIGIRFWISVRRSTLWFQGTKFDFRLDIWLWTGQILTNLVTWKLDRKQRSVISLTLLVKLILFLPFSLGWKLANFSFEFLSTFNIRTNRKILRVLNFLVLIDVEIQKYV